MARAVALDAVQRLDARHRREDAVHHLGSHGAQQVGEARVGAHVVLKAVGAPQVAVVGRHEDVVGHLPDVALVQPAGELAEVLLLRLRRHLGQVAAPTQDLERSLGGSGYLAAGRGLLRAPVAVQRPRGTAKLARPHPGRYPARHLVEGARVAVDEEHLLAVARQVHVDGVTARPQHGTSRTEHLRSAPRPKLTCQTVLASEGLGRQQLGR